MPEPLPFNAPPTSTLHTPHYTLHHTTGNAPSIHPHHPPPPPPTSNLRPPTPAPAPAQARAARNPMTRHGKAGYRSAASPRPPARCAASSKPVCGSHAMRPSSRLLEPTRRNNQQRPTTSSYAPESRAQTCYVVGDGMRWDGMGWAYSVISDWMRAF